MILGHISQLDDVLPVIHPAFCRALEHLRDADLERCPAGNYELEGKDIYLQVIDLSTKPLSECRPEVHREYVDIHYLVRGRERIAAAIDSGDFEVAEDFRPDRDLRFYRDVPPQAVYDMRPGSFAIFVPSDVHAPGGAGDVPEPIRKVVVKIRMSLVRR